MMSVHVLNVGNGDSIIVELPEINGNRSHIIVDCKRKRKTTDYLDNLDAEHLGLVVATHPHEDHIAGLRGVMRDYEGNVDEFWDCGFWHASDTWADLMTYLDNKPEIHFLRPTSGLSTNLSGVEVTVLAPSIMLRNRYDTYGVNINNSSIVLKLEYKERVMILSADAQWDSWAKMTEEFPHYERTPNPRQHILLDEGFNPLDCDFLKVPHHGSKHGTSLEAIERVGPSYTAISCMFQQRRQFPHHLTMDILREEGSNIRVTEDDGTLVYTVDGQGNSTWYRSGERIYDNPPPPHRPP